jgi:hypothetical protein
MRFSLGIAVVSLEGGGGSEFGDLGDGDALEIHGGRAWLDVWRDSVVDLAEDGSGDAHLLDLSRRFDHDGHRGKGITRSE